MQNIRFGNGSIVPWSPSQVADLSKEEVYCHWVSDLDKGSVQASFERRFAGNEILVIGAAPVFKTNGSCSQRDNPDRMMTKLRAKSRVTLLNAKQEAFLLETKQRELQAGVSPFGIFNVKIGRSYKHHLDESLGS
jgi:hypothetical protein